MDRNAEVVVDTLTLWFGSQSSLNTLLGWHFDGEGALKLVEAACREHCGLFPCSKALGRL